MAETGNSGIYEIVNLVNGKRYIGSAQSLHKRRGQHWTRLRNGWHHSRHLQNSWNKYGEQRFCFKVLLFCRIDDLLFYEQRAIDVLKPELNVCLTAGSTLGRRHSPATRAKIGARKVGLKMAPRSIEHREAISRALVGKQKDAAHAEKFQAGRRAFVQTEEHRAGVSAALRVAYQEGRHRRDRPPEYRNKIAATLTGRKLTAEHRANVSRSMTGKKRGPYKLDPAKAEQRRAQAAIMIAKRWPQRKSEATS